MAGLSCQTRVQTMSISKHSSNNSFISKSLLFDSNQFFSARWDKKIVFNKRFLMKNSSPCRAINSSQISLLRSRRENGSDLQRCEAQNEFGRILIYKSRRSPANEFAPVQSGTPHLSNYSTDVSTKPAKQTKQQ
jgi:hypothetical protein